MTVRPSVRFVSVWVFLCLSTANGFISDVSFKVCYCTQYYSIGTIL